jgi:hypothetical protein
MWGLVLTPARHAGYYEAPAGTRMEVMTACRLMQRYHGCVEPQPRRLGLLRPYCCAQHQLRQRRVVPTAAASAESAHCPKSERPVTN